MRIFEVITQTELDQVEKFADALWGKVGIDVRFTRHFLKRMNDTRNGKDISAGELVRLFKKQYYRYSKEIAANAETRANFEAVMTDVLTNVNLPFIIVDKPDGSKELVAKTIMRKPKFTTSNRKYQIESQNKK